MDKLKYLTLLLPIISGFATSQICKMGGDSGSNVKFRPPAWVFAVVWPILYLMMGCSWFIALKNADNFTDKVVVNVFYSSLMILLALWIVIYSCRKNPKGAVYVLLASLVVCIGILVGVGNTLGKMLMVPLMGWLLFALLMNITQVQQIKN